MRRVGQFANLRGDWQERGGGGGCVFERGVDIPMYTHYDIDSFENGFMNTLNKYASFFHNFF